MELLTKGLTAMDCPHCCSNRITGPAYGPSRRGRAAFMRCQSCLASFDAYESWGAGGKGAR